MNENKELIIVTDWERVSADDFYLTEKWMYDLGIDPSVRKETLALQADNKLYIAYIVPAVSYAIYTQMDASQVLINDDMDVVLNCESAVIGNSHMKRAEFSY